MKHAQIAITNQAASPAIHGMLLIKPARNNAVVPISILVQEAIKPAEAEQRVMASIINALVPPHIHGKVALALVIQHTNMLVHQEI